jgi:hypothetical protein
VHLIDVHLIGAYLMSVYLINVYLTGVYPMSVYLTGVHLKQACSPHRACISEFQILKILEFLVFGKTSLYPTVVSVLAIVIVEDLSSGGPRMARSHLGDNAGRSDVPLGIWIEHTVRESLSDRQ